MTNVMENSKNPNSTALAAQSAELPGVFYEVTDANRTTVSMYVETNEDAKAVAASFPKSVKVRASKAYGLANGKWTTCGWVTFCVEYKATGVTGTENEGGLKRLAAFRKNAAKLGFQVIKTTS
jgi:hypothetical protein